MTHDHPRDMARRSLLRAAAGAVLTGSALYAAAPASFAASADLTSGRSAAGESAAAGVPLPLTIVNGSGTHENSSVHVYIMGTANNRQVHVNEAGVAVPVALSDNKANGYTDYAIPLAAATATQLKLPRMSGRIYLSMGEKLKIKAVPDGTGKPSLQYPAGWASGDPNYHVLHDFVEFTHDATGMHCNTTMVDMFSIPMNLQLTGGSGHHTTGEVRKGGRAAVFAAVQKAQPFHRLVVDGLRVIAPGHGIDVGLFPADYYGPYIDQVWNHYKQNNLTVNTNAGTFTGRVGGSGLTFHGPATFSLGRPTTHDVFFCDGALQAPNDGIQGPVAAVLGAGFNRSVLLRADTQPTKNAADFYQTTITNHYAKAIHNVVNNGKAYGFAFDDVGGFESYVSDAAPQHLQLTITPF